MTMIFGEKRDKIHAFLLSCHFLHYTFCNINPFYGKSYTYTAYFATLYCIDYSNKWKYNTKCREFCKNIIGGNQNEKLCKC